MAFNITTTGTHSPVVFYDLGERSFIHPINNYDLELEYNQSEIQSSNDIQDAIDNGWITITDANGNSITSTEGVVSHSKLSGLTEDDHSFYAKTIGVVRGVFNINSPVNDEVMTYNSTNSEWYNKAIEPSFNNEHQEASNDIESATTSSTYITKLTMTTPNLPEGKYRIGWSAEVKNSSNSGCTKLQTHIDSTIIAESQMGTANTEDWQPRNGFYYITLSGVNNIYIDYSTGYTSNCTATIRRARLEIWRIS